MDCPHIRIERAIDAATGESHVFHGRIDPRLVDCEVCRKLLAFGDLLEACRVAEVLARKLTHGEIQPSSVAWGPLHAQLYLAIHPKRKEGQHESV